MTTSEYLEYCEDDFKIQIKLELKDLQFSKKKQYADYFEKDVKEEIVDEKYLHSKLNTYTCYNL